jgi:hypothetical protein
MVSGRIRLGHRYSGKKYSNQNNQRSCWSKITDWYYNQNTL